MTFLSDRVNRIPPSGIRVFFDLVLSSKGIISLGVGEPDFLTPWNIRDEAIYRVEKGFTTYTSNKGLEELRGAISHFLKQQFSIAYDKHEILITSGVSEAVDLVFRSFINPNDDRPLMIILFCECEFVYKITGKKLVYICILVVMSFSTNHSPI